MVINRDDLIALIIVVVVVVVLISSLSKSCGYIAAKALEAFAVPPRASFVKSP
jgi:hypothetical protein